MKVVLVDDEQLAVEVLEILLSRIENIEVVGRYTNPRTAIQEAERLKPDVVFLDIEMGEFHGIDIAKELREKLDSIDIVFVTAHAHFAVEAFEVIAFDYLMKPVSAKRLDQTIDRLIEKRNLQMKPLKIIKPKEKILSLQASGNFKLHDEEGSEIKWRTRKVKELFVYLWHHSPNAVHRFRILEDLWGEYDKARATTLLHTSLYQLRKTIKENGFHNPVKLVNEQYVLNMELNSDVSEIERIMRSEEMTWNGVEAVIGLYKGDYLEEENYDWALPRQQQWKGGFLAYLEKYSMIEMAQEKPSNFLEYCLGKMIELEPYNERFIYLLVDYYGKTKNLQKMAAAIENFKTMWIRELGIDIPDEIYDAFNEHMMRV